MEDIDTQAFALSDPRYFLKSNLKNGGIILDEVQLAPDLLSYLQTMIDLNPEDTRVILTSSEDPSHPHALALT